MNELKLNISQYFTNIYKIFKETEKYLFDSIKKENLNKKLQDIFLKERNYIYGMIIFGSLTESIIKKKIKTDTNTLIPELAKGIIKHPEIDLEKMLTYYKILLNDTEKIDALKISFTIMNKISQDFNDDEMEIMYEFLKQFTSFTINSIESAIERSLVFKNTNFSYKSPNFDSVVCEDLNNNKNNKVEIDIKIKSNDKTRFIQSDSGIFMYKVIRNDAKVIENYVICNVKDFLDFKKSFFECEIKMLDSIYEKEHKISALNTLLQKDYETIKLKEEYLKELKNE